jgi:predicted O-methyltransferase YrrM
LARNAVDFLVRPASVATRMLAGGLWKDASLRGEYRSSLRRWDLALTSRLRQVRLEEIVTAQDVPVLHHPTRRDGNLSLDALYSIAALVKQARPRRIFEIGTFNGNATLQMAVNSPAECHIYTLDLPKRPAATTYDLDREDEKYVGCGDHVFAGTEWAHKITPLVGDSGNFDFSPYRGTIDFVFVDGAHSYAYVKSDTQRAFEMLSPGGVVVWDDYDPCWPDVVRWLDELGRTKPVVWILGTGLCMYRAGSAPGGPAR